MKRQVRINQDQKQMMAKEYDDGMSIRDLASKYGIAVTTTRRHLKSNGRRIPSVGMNTRRHEIDRSFFRVESEARDYFVGLLMADGCNHGYSFSISLKTQDSHIIETMRDLICPTAKISTIDYKRNILDREKTTHVNGVKLIICSIELIRDLESFGFMKRKSSSAKVSQLEGSKHFWRGVFDGDGCISFNTYKGKSKTSQYPTICLAGSLEMTTQFSVYCSKIHGKTGQIKFHKGCYYYRTANKAAAKVIHELYDGSTYHLNRKKELADRIALQYG